VDRGLKWQLTRITGDGLEDEERYRLVREIGELQADLKAQEDRKVDGLLARLRVKRLEEGERPTKYLSGILRAREVQQSWTSVIGDSGQEITEIGGMLEEVSTRWSDLWTDNEDSGTEEDGEENPVSGTGGELLDNWQVAKVGGLGGQVLCQVTLAEVLGALDEVQEGSLPGVDGLL